VNAVDATEERVIGVVQEMNRAWTGSWDEKKFREFIHPEAVAIVPTTGGRIEGRERYVESWRQFAADAKILAWEETGHHVRFFCSGTCAVVTYLFSIRFVIGGPEQEMKGRDMLVLVYEQGRWLVAADQFSPEPPAL